MIFTVWIRKYVNENEKYKHPVQSDYDYDPPNESTLLQSQRRFAYKNPKG